MFCLLKVPEKINKYIYLFYYGTGFGVENGKVNSTTREFSPRLLSKATNTIICVTCGQKSYPEQNSKISNKNLLSLWNSLDGESPTRGQKSYPEQTSKISNKNWNIIVLRYVNFSNRNQVLNDSNEENNLKMDNSKNDEWKSNNLLVRCQVLCLLFNTPQSLLHKLQFLNFLKSNCFDSSSQRGKIASVGNNHSNFLFLSFLVKLLLTIPYLIISRCC